MGLMNSYYFTIVNIIIFSVLLIIVLPCLLILFSSVLFFIYFEFETVYERRRLIRLKVISSLTSLGLALFNFPLAAFDVSVKLQSAL